MRIRGRDRISFLPDEIIGHILSFLPTKYAVQTSVLSMRWQYLWTFITSFDFKDDISDERNPACVARRILTCCSSKMINKFSLTLNSYICTLCLDACIDELCKRNVCELRLEGLLLNHCIFAWKTLTALDLKSNVIVLDTEDIPTFDLPKLKKLRTHLFYPSSDLSEKLFSSCPVLEDLTIEGTVRSETKFNLSCPLLKRLKIQLQAWDFEGLKYKFVINAPNLKYLELIDMFKAEYVVENLTSVVEAKLNMRQGAADEIFGNLAAELLWAFRNLQSLSMDEDCLAVLNDPGRRDLPTFKDMKRLELFFNDYSDQEMIAPLLNVCPNLESLILFESFAEGEKSRAHQRYMETCGLELVPINVMGLKIFLLEVVISVMAPRINSSQTRPS